LFHLLGVEAIVMFTTAKPDDVFFRSGSAVRKPTIVMFVSFAIFSVPFFFRYYLVKNTHPLCNTKQEL
jgi:hypothetical protein